MKYTLIVLLCTVCLIQGFNRDLIAQKRILIDENTQLEATTINNPKAKTDEQTSSNDFVLGRIEVVGGTCYDWVNGPCATWCINDPTNGIHVTWLWSNTSGLTDRNMRYNFYDWSTHSWNWIDNNNYMNSGINVFSHTMTSVAGGADLDRTTGNFVIAGNYGTSGSILPKLARDLVPGGGLFEYTEGPLGWRWPFIALSQNQAIHVACVDVTTTDSLYYTRCQPWGTWTTPINICRPQPAPMFPNHNIAASKVSNKVCIVWEYSEDVGQERAFYRISNDGGINWQSIQQLPFPPSVGFAPSFGVSSLFVMYDVSDNLHIVASVSDTNRTVPAEIWHWCPTNNPQWSLIHRFDPDTLTAPVGYNAIFATRPSIIQEPTTGYFYVAWEQFDSLNFEPSTNRARADIHIAQSNNNGQTWNAKARITDPNTTSKRFPVVGGVQVTPSPTVKDTLLVFYMIDSIAGAFLQNEHRFCVNPMVVHRVPVPLSPAIEENNNVIKPNLELQVLPNPITNNAMIKYSLPKSGKVNLLISDITGRTIQVLRQTFEQAGSYTIQFSSKSNSKRKLSAGIYFITLTTGEGSITKKILIK